MTATPPLLPVQTVNTQELHAAGGVVTVRKLDERQQKKVAEFYSSHLHGRLQSNQAAATSAVKSSSTERVAQSNLRQTSAIHQIDAKELADAVALRGGAGAGSDRRAQKHRQMYRVLISADERFMARDLESMLHHVKTQSKSLVDLSTSTNLDSKAFRKYLLLSMIESESERLDAYEKGFLSGQKKKILQFHGDYIAKQVASFEVSKAAVKSGLAVTQISLREYIKAFSLRDRNENEPINPESLLVLYRAISKSSGSKSAVSKDIFQCIRELASKLVDNLARENTQNPSRASAFRQHIVLSQINQLRTLSKLVALHASYVKACQDLPLKNVPSFTDLTDLTLRIFMGDVAAGVGELVRVLGAVTGDFHAARNAAAVNYINRILKDARLAFLFKNSAQQLQMTDQLMRHLVSGGLLSIRRT